MSARLWVIAECVCILCYQPKGKELVALLALVITYLMIKQLIAK